MPTADGTIDQKLFFDLEGIFYCLLPKTIMQMKHLQSTKFYLSLSAQIKLHNWYLSIINNRGVGIAHFNMATRVLPVAKPRKCDINSVFYCRIIWKQSPLKTIYRGVQDCTPVKITLRIWFRQILNFFIYSFKITCIKPMENFAENLNLGKRVPPPAIMWNMNSTHILSSEFVKITN